MNGQECSVSMYGCQACCDAMYGVTLALHEICTTMPYNTSVSFVVRLYPNSGTLLLYVGVDDTPTPADRSTYLLAQLYNTTQNTTRMQLYTAQSIYIPAAACSSLTAVGQSCTVVFMASSSEWRQDIWVKPLSSAGAVWLLENQGATDATVTSLTITYQFSLAPALLLVTLTVNASSPLTVWCSYQYVTPDSMYNDWQWQVDSDSGTVNSSSRLNFTWGDSTATTSPLVTNPNTRMAAAATTCYCTVLATRFDSYSLAYSTTPLPSTTQSSTDHGLSGGALVAAVVVPIVAVLLLAAVVVVWVRRGGCGLCLGGGWHAQVRLAEWQCNAEARWTGRDERS